MKYLKSYNESIRHLLKPKSEEEILNNFKNLDDYSSLRKAAEYGVLPIIKEIVERTNLSPDNYDLYVTLSISIIYDQIDIVKYLVDEIGVDPFINIPKRDFYTFNRYHSAFDNAISLNRIDIIKFLLNDPRIIHHVLPDRINYYKKTYSDKIEESIRHLLKPKSEDDIKKILGDLIPTEKLLSSCKYGIFNVVKDLNSLILELPNDDNYPLVLAATYGHNDIVKYLLDIGMHPNPEENFYKTSNPLNEAIKEGHFDVIKTLLKHKDIDILMIDDLYMNSIVTCINYKKYNILKYIIKIKKDIFNWYLEQDHGVADDIEDLKNKGII